MAAILEGKRLVDWKARNILGMDSDVRTRLERLMTSPFAAEPPSLSTSHSQCAAKPSTPPPEGRSGSGCDDSGLTALPERGWEAADGCRRPYAEPRHSASPGTIRIPDNYLASLAQLGNVRDKSKAAVILARPCFLLTLPDHLLVDVMRLLKRHGCFASLVRFSAACRRIRYLANLAGLFSFVKLESVSLPVSEQYLCTWATLFPLVREIEFSRCVFDSDTSVEELIAAALCPDLEALSIGYPETRTGALRSRVPFLSHAFPFLRRLHLRFVPSATDDVLSAIFQSSSRLTEVSPCYTGPVNGKTLAALIVRHSQSLVCLKLNGMTIRGDRQQLASAIVHHGNQWEVFEFTQNHFYFKQEHWRDILGSFTKLKRLDLTDTNVEVSFLKQIRPSCRDTLAEAKFHFLSNASDRSLQDFRQSCSKLKSMSCS